MILKPTDPIFKHYPGLPKEIHKTIRRQQKKVLKERKWNLNRRHWEEISLGHGKIDSLDHCKDREFVILRAGCKPKINPLFATGEEYIKDEHVSGWMACISTIHFN